MILLFQNSTSKTKMVPKFYAWFCFIHNCLAFSFEQSIAEATKIAKIREELEKLDQELAADVEILRKEIETVTQQYTATK